MLVALDVAALPLADAGSAGVGQHGRAGLLERGQLSVALGRRADLLGAGCDQQRRAQFQPRFRGLARDIGRAADVLVGRVGAGADQGVGHLGGVGLFGHERADRADGVAQVRRVRADPGRLELAQVDLDYPVEDLLSRGFHLVVRAQMLGVLARQGGDFGPLGALQIGRGSLVEGEQRGGRADLGAHVGDCAAPRRAERGHAGAEVLDDRPGAALHGQFGRHADDHILGGGPAVQRAGQVDADQPRHRDAPADSGHHIDRVRAAYADRDHSQAAGVGRVAVGADHHSAGEGVVFQHDLVDDSAAGLPETRAVARRGAAQEGVDLLVLIHRPRQVGVGSDLRLNQVVAVDGGRDHHPFEAGQLEL